MGKMVKEYDCILNNIVNLFGESFKRYNATIVLLIIPLTFFATVTKYPCFVVLQILEVCLLVLNAVYIVCRVVKNKDFVFGKNKRKE